MEWLTSLPAFIDMVGDRPFKMAIVVVMFLGIKEIKLLRHSVNRLHESIAVIIERISSHEKRITTLERKKK